MDINDKNCLKEIYERMKNVHKEHEDADYMVRFKNIIDSIKPYIQPEYSHIETTYCCGKKPHWSIGDVLAYYEYYSDREGEHVLGKISMAEHNKEIDDWLYTFEDGSIYDEQTLLEDSTYKINEKKYGK